MPARTAPDLERRQHVTGLLRSLLAQERTWTARQLSEALAPHQVRLGPRQLRRYLGHLRAGYRRTASTLKHKQDPARAAHAAAVLDNLQRRPTPACWSCTTWTSAASPRRCRPATAGRCRGSGSG